MKKTLSYTHSLKLSLFLLGLIFFSTPAQAAEVLDNKGFESGMPTFNADSWTEFGTAGVTTAAAEWWNVAFGNGSARTGSGYLKLASFGGPGVLFSGAFQDVTSGFSVGDTVVFQAYAKKTGVDTLSFLHLKIEFIGSASAPVESSTNIATSSTYSASTISGTVPTGTTSIRFTIVHSMNGASSSEYFVDDVSAIISSGVSASSCNFPSNSSFERTGASGEEILPGWTRFPLGSALVTQRDNATLAHSALDGSRAIQMGIFGGMFTGIFQIIGGVLPDAEIDFSIYARTDNMAGGAFGQLKIEFKDANDHLLEEVLSDEITSANAFGEYKQFSVSGKAPAGTAFAVLVILGDAGAGGGGDIVFDRACATFDNGPVKITGDVFSSTNGQLIPGTRVELLDASGRVIATDSDNPFQFIVPNGSSRSLRAIAEGYTFPSRINDAVVGGDHGELFSAVVDTKISLPMDPGYPLVLRKDVNKKQASRGDLLVYKLHLKNNSTFAINNVLLIDELPEAFEYRNGTAQRNGERITDPTRNSPLTFNLGTIQGSEEVTISYVTQTGTRSELGRRYISPAVARSSNLNIQLSNTSTTQTIVLGDPTFDLGTIIGKVFNDQNKNGKQDKGELGIPDVRLATEEGTVVYTDRYGRYHVPGVKPGRHLIKVDRHSLPPGSTFVTEESFLVRTTEGILSKANFAVSVPADTSIPEAYKDKIEVHVTQQYDKFTPKLDVQASNNEPQILSDKWLEPLYFYMDGNYLDTVTGWKIEIRDHKGKTIKTLEGGPTVPSRTSWDGKTDEGTSIEAGKEYYYQLFVTDGTHEDWTVTKTLRPTHKKKIASVVERSSFVQLDDNERPHQSIPVTNKNSVMVRGHAEAGTTIKINGQDTYVHEDGTFEKEVLLPPGVQVVKISNTDAKGKTITYVRELDVQDNYFFMVGMAEGELGGKDVTSHLESVSDEDEFDDGFYENGRIAYYLKAKVKGRYLITSSLDTSRSNNTKFFTNLDPDRYYPVYGDGSVIDYRATDTRNNLFLLLEMDKSYFQWGSFETGLTDLDLATYNRTLSGAKLHAQREKTNTYGDPYGGITGFYAEDGTNAGHDEFLGTGGSLYYLKYNQVVEGSEKVQVVTRDRVTGRVSSRIDLTEGLDYEMDYRSGRIILTKPLSSVTGSNSIVSSNILPGNTSSLVVDYEHLSSSPFENPTRAVRGYQQVLDNVRVGGTFVQEDRQGPDYKMLGGDILMKLGKWTKFIAEYAQSRGDQSGTRYSQDGGISFNASDPTYFRTIQGNTRSINVTLDEYKAISPQDYLNTNLDYEQAYSLKAQTAFSDRLKTKAYYTYIAPGFSNTSSLLEEGTQKMGVEASLKLAATTFLNVRHDTQKLLNDPIRSVGLYSPTTIGGPNPLSSSLVDGSRSHTTSAQLTHDIGKWELTGEYQHREIEDPLTFDDPLSGFFQFTNESSDTLAAKARYHWSGRFIPFIAQQVTVAGPDNHQTSVGADVKVTEKIWLQGQETVGTRGNSTLVGVQAQTSEKTRMYINQMMGTDHSLGRASRTTFGTRTDIDERSNFTTEKQYTNYRKGQLESSLFGYETRLQKGWSFGSTYERIDSDDDLSRDAVSGTLSYSKWNWLNASTKFEFRQDEGFSDVTLRQYLTQNLIKWQLTEDLQWLGRVNYGLTENRSSDIDAACFYEAGTGFAYRPVYADRLNFIGKYSYLSDDDPEAQSDFGLNILERSHLASIEGAYDINRWFQLVEKYAFKFGEVSVLDSDFIEVKNHLWINRINFHITKKWDLAGEYRILKETETGDRKSGFLVEVDRQVIDHIRLGAGYNFTDFSDDLRTGAEDNAHKFFIRLTGDI